MTAVRSMGKGNLFNNGTGAVLTYMEQWNRMSIT